jgi:hypothetical protein
VDYKCTFLDWKNSQKKAPTITSVTLADSPEAGRFTSGTFRSTVVADDGTPAATKGIKAWVQGTLTTKLTSTNAITAVTQQPGNAGTWTWQNASTGITVTGNVAHSPTAVLAINGAASRDFNRMSTAGVWTTRSFPETFTPTTITYTRSGAVGAFAVVANTASTAAYFSSDDGQTWASSGRPAFVGGATYALGSYWLSGSDGQLYRAAAATGPYTRQAHPGGGTSYGHMSGNSSVVICSDASNHSWYSSDGSHWTKLTTTAACDAVGGIYVAGGKVSKDLITWVSPSPFLPGPVIYDFTTNTYFSANGPCTKYRVSGDGIHWSGDLAGASNLSANTRYAAFQGRFVAWKLGQADITDIPVIPPSTTLTIAGAQSDGFKPDDGVANADTAPTAIGGLTAVSDTAVTVVPADTDWAIGQKLHGVPKTAANAKLYCKLNAGLTVTDLQSADPGYTAVTGAGPYTITFPATLPTGAAPDADLPAGTTITTEVQAVNSAGTVTNTSNTVTPT